MKKWRDDGLETQYTITMTANVSVDSGVLYDDGWTADIIHCKSWQGNCFKALIYYYGSLTASTDLFYGESDGIYNQTVYAVTNLINKRKNKYVVPISKV